MAAMIAFCGLDCSECEAYQATQANDEAWKEQIAAKWREEYNAPEIDVVGVTCDGCMAHSGRLCANCPICELRICGIERGVENCGLCADYEICDKIAHLFEFMPSARLRLDAIHANR